MSNGNQQQNNQQKTNLSWNDQKNINTHKPTSSSSSNNSFNNTQTPQGGSGRLVAMFVAGVILCTLIVWGIAALRAENRQITQDDKSVKLLDSTATSTATTSSDKVDTVSAKPRAVVTSENTAPSSTVSPSSTGNEAPASITSSDFATAAQPAGDTVTVTGLSVTEPMWLVIYDSTSGKAGGVLGAGMVFQGQSSVKVPLQRATKSTKTYMVGMSKTDNGSHEFSLTLPKLDKWSTFTAQ